jgi:hypothetical protein
MIRDCLRALTALTIATAALSAAPSAPAHTAAAPDCRGFADIPRSADLHSTLPQLYAWGQFDCDAPARLAVQICTIRFTPTPVILDDKVVWCVHRIVRIPAGHTTFVRAPLHRCTPGKGYASYVRILGQAWDRGPWTRCRTL